MKEDIRELKTQIKPFWEAVEKMVPSMLHSPHTPETDKLLERVENGCKLTLQEIRTLKDTIFVALRNNEYDKWKRLPAALLISRLEMLEGEILRKGESTVLKESQCLK